MNLEDFTQALETREKALKFKIDKIKRRIPIFRKVFSDSQLEDLIIGHMNMEYSNVIKKVNKIFPIEDEESLCRFHKYYRLAHTGDPIYMFIENAKDVIGSKEVVYHGTYMEKLLSILKKGLELGHKGGWGKGLSNCLFKKYFYEPEEDNPRWINTNFFPIAIIINPENLHKDGLKLQSGEGWNDEVIVKNLEGNDANLPVKYISTVVFRDPLPVEFLGQCFNANHNIQVYIEGNSVYSREYYTKKIFPDHPNYRLEWTRIFKKINKQANNSQNKASQ